MKKVAYIRCPRCELNFIQKKDKYCAVCKAEMSANKDDFIDDLDLELCPICKTNYIQSDEVMCQSCLKERGNDEDEVNQNQDEWNSYVQQDEDDFILPNEETGELAIVDLDDDDLDEDMGLVDEEFDEDEDDNDEENNDDDDFDDDYDFDEEDDEFDDDDED